MDTINLEVLRQLQEYASVYFNAIVELNSVNGKCNLQPGKYSAKEMATDPYKTFGQYYALPQDNEFDEEITVQSGTFHASFPYRQIFRILNEWENMCRAGKLKAIFEIEGAEEKTAPVVLNERTALGTLKTKKMKLQRIAGNWWKPRKITKNTYNVTAYYELNGVMFPGGGKTFYVDSIDSDKTREWCEKWNDEKMIEITRSYINNEKNSEEFRLYYREVLQMAGVSTEEAKEEPQKPQIPTESAETKEVSAEGEKREETANVVEMKRHYDNKAYSLYKRNLYKFNDNIYAFGEEAELLREFFRDNKFVKLEWVEHQSNGIYYLRYHYSHQDKIKEFLKKKLKLENILIGIWDSEEVLYWSKYNPPTTPTEPPQDTETDGRHNIPPKPKEAVRNVPAVPPEPPKAVHILSGPPGFQIIITPTINKNLILQNYDRHNCLAPPHLHHRGLRLPRLPDGSGCNLRYLRFWHPHIVASCQTDRQASRGSPRRPREGDRRMGKEMGKKTPFTQIIISNKSP